jgi:hypothetical protein
MPEHQMVSFHFLFFTVVLAIIVTYAVCSYSTLGLNSKQRPRSVAPPHDISPHALVELVMLQLNESQLLRQTWEKERDDSNLQREKENKEIKDIMAAGFAATEKGFAAMEKGFADAKEDREKIRGEVNDGFADAKKDRENSRGSQRWVCCSEERSGENPRGKQSVRERNNSAWEISCAPIYSHS